MFPGLAAGEELRARGHRVTLWLTGRKIESSTISGWNESVVTIPVVSPRSPVAAIQFISAILECAREMRVRKPDVLLAMGSYAAVPPVLGARMAGVPVVLHEGNAVPGRALSFLSRHASAIGVSFNETRHFFRGKKCILTGFPLRAQFSARPTERLLPPGMFTLLVTGGSQGAHFVNQVTSEAVCALWKRGTRLQVIHLSGPADCDKVRAAYTEAGVPSVVMPFCQEMPKAYITSDFAVCRSGAGTCSELAVMGVPALLIPLPRAPRDHQTANAVAMKTLGAADLIPQNSLTAEKLTEYLRGIITEAGKLASMRAAVRGIPSGNAAGKLAELVIDTARV